MYIKIYHYSNTDIKSKLKTKHFGTNSYSQSSRRLSGVKRLYFYLNKKDIEYHLQGCKYLYIAKISREKLYNLNKDILNITNKYNNTDDIFRAIKKQYIGLIGNNGCGCAVLFKDIKYSKKITCRG